MYLLMATLYNLYLRSSIPAMDVLLANLARTVDSSFTLFLLRYLSNSCILDSGILSLKTRDRRCSIWSGKWERMRLAHSVYSFCFYRWVGRF